MKPSSSKKISNRAFFSGYALLLLLMIYLGIIQFSSTAKLRELQQALSDYLLISLSASHETSSVNMSPEASALSGNDLFHVLMKTLPQNRTIPELNGTANDISTLYALNQHISEYEASLYNSIEILFISFLLITIIITIVVSFSEVDSYRKFLKEKQAKELDRKLVFLLEQERNRIALELHDDTAQKISVINQIVLSNDNRGDEQILLKRYLKEVINGIRHMAHELRSPQDDGVNWEDKLFHLYADFSILSEIRLSYEHRGVKEFHPNQEQELHIYRIIQELLSNGRRHSKATNLKLNLIFSYPLLKIIYEDNGVGMNWRSNNDGLGINGIKYRTAILNGSIDFRIKEEGGTVITLTAPMT